jgi:hypothetical protein
MNAQNTIKKLLKNVTHFKPPGDDLCVAAAIVQVQNDVSYCTVLFFRGELKLLLLGPSYR